LALKIDSEFNFLVQKASKSSGVALTSYRDSYLRRRIDLRMKVVGIDNYATYTRLLDKNQIAGGHPNLNRLSDNSILE